MGYYMHVRETDFRIRHENVLPALKAIRALHGKESIMDGSGRHFSWVPQDFHERDTFEETLECWCWSPLLDEEGNIEDLCFVGEKRGDDDILFGALAPFVEDGSYIEMQGEDGERWRWIFAKGTMRRRTPKVVWD